MYPFNLPLSAHACCWVLFRLSKHRLYNTLSQHQSNSQAELSKSTIECIYLFALRIAVSYSQLYSVREIWFVSTCHSRQGNSCVRAPLRSRSNPVSQLHSKFRPSARTPRWGSRVLYRQRTDHVGCFCCRAIVQLFLLLLIISLFVSKDCAPGHLWNELSRGESQTPCFDLATQNVRQF